MGRKKREEAKRDQARRWTRGGLGGGKEREEQEREKESSVDRCLRADNPTRHPLGNRFKPFKFETFPTPLSEKKASPFQEHLEAIYIYTYTATSARHINTSRTEEGNLFKICSLSSPLSPFRHGRLLQRIAKCFLREPFKSLPFVLPAVTIFRVRFPFLAAPKCRNVWCGTKTDLY